MPWKQLIGTKAENRVKEWLLKKGFRLINQSWNCCYGEIDIIASFFGQLHCIAVTIKTHNESGLPAEGVTRKKMLACKQAAQKYMEYHPRWEKVIFDVLAVAPDTTEIVLVENIRTI